MSLILQEVKDKTESIFEEELKVPELIHFKDRLTAFKESKLERQYRSCLFDMRIEQAKAMGFVPLAGEEMVQMLMKEPHNHSIIEPWYTGAMRYGWAYNHHENKVLDDDSISLRQSDYKRKGWFGKEIWKLRLGSLDYLKEIPYGVVLRVNELKKLRFFNAFDAIAPMAAWDEEAVFTEDPIVVATIWELPIRVDKSSQRVGRREHFFLAQW